MKRSDIFYVSCSGHFLIKFRQVGVANLIIIRINEAVSALITHERWSHRLHRSLRSPHSLNVLSHRFSMWTPLQPPRALPPFSLYLPLPSQNRHLPQIRPLPVRSSSCTRGNQIDGEFEVSDWHLEDDAQVVEVKERTGRWRAWRKNPRNVEAGLWGWSYPNDQPGIRFRHWAWIGLAAWVGEVDPRCSPAKESWASLDFTLPYKSGYPLPSSRSGSYCHINRPQKRRNDIGNERVG